MKTVEPKTNQWRVSVQNVRFFLRENYTLIKALKPNTNQWRVNYQIVWFSLRENHMLITTYQAIRGICIATFQENPCARMQIMHQSEDLRAPVSSRLFKRIFVQEYRKCLRTMVVQEACRRHFSRESSCENKH